MSLSVSEDGRYFLHQMPTMPSSQDTLSDSERKRIKEKLEKIIMILDTKFPSSTPAQDPGLYIGQSGVALFYLHLAKHHPDAQKRDFLSKAVAHLSHPVKDKRVHRAAFLDGIGGILVARIILSVTIGQQQQANQFVQQYLNLSEEALVMESNEFLYGKAGYLYGAMLINKHMKDKVVSASKLKELGLAIIEAGRKGARGRKDSPPLYFEWHEKPYVGAAHGFAGILHTLLCCPEVLEEPQARVEIKNTLDHMIGWRYESGNFISSLGSNKDKLVQWCHGSPGVLPTLCKAYEVFGDRRYMDIASTCADDVWMRGLLTKGTGLCHGISGNAYSFFNMYSATRSPKYLYYAHRFAIFGCQLQTESQASFPYSLFEGISGFGYFLVDTLYNNHHPRFPCYEL